ncbi:MAG TPA: ABC transporter permease subunit [Candidatus Bathyarchaeia archaeon]
MANKKFKGKPFLEIFASSLQEDYRFPLLEFFAFLYALGTFVLANISVVPEEQSVYGLVSSLMGLPVIIFMILVFKNIAYGLGGDLEKGTIQTLFSYPLKRYAIFLAKLLSAVGAALLVLFGIQMFALVVLAPAMILPYISTVMTTYLASLSYPLLLASVILLFTLIVRKGGLAIVIGIVMFFAGTIFQSLATFVSLGIRSPLLLQILSVVNPSVAMQYHYHNLSVPAENLGTETIWAPTSTEVLTYMGTAYLLVFAVLLLSYYFFSRRMNL